MEVDAISRLLLGNFNSLSQSRSDVLRRLSHALSAAAQQVANEISLQRRKSNEAINSLLRQIALLFQEVYATLSAYLFPMSNNLPLVLTGLGKIRGKRVRTRENRAVYSFRAIPYARPPVGYLRFALPEPMLPWGGTLDCAGRGESPSCLQVNVLSPESKFFLGSEDCLYLNVFTPHLPGAGRSALFPVMVFFHGKKDKPTVSLYDRGSTKLSGYRWRLLRRIERQ